MSAIVLQKGLTSSNEEKESSHAVHKPSDVTDLLAPAQHTLFHRAAWLYTDVHTVIKQDVIAVFRSDIMSVDLSISCASMCEPGDFGIRAQIEHNAAAAKLAKGSYVQYRMKPTDSPMMMPMTAGIGMELTGKPALTPAMKTTASRPSLRVVVKARTQIPHLPG